MRQKLFQNFFIIKNWSFCKQHIKGTVKATSKIENIYISDIYRKYLLCLKSSASGSCLQICINFVEQRLKISHFEGSTIPKFLF